MATASLVREHQERALEEQWARAEIVKQVAAANRGRDAGSFQCFSCKRFKSEPAAICGYCGDDPVSHNGDRHDFNRAYGYASYIGGSGMKREQRSAPAVRAPKEVKPSTSKDVERALGKRLEANAALEAALLGLPAGDERRAAIRAALNAGVTQGELARLMGISRARVSQLVAEATAIPF